MRRAVIAAIAALALAGPAAAQPPVAPGAVEGEPGEAEGMTTPADVDRARALYQAGSAAYQAKQYGAAVDAFEEAFRLAPRPSVMYSLAQARRLKFYLEGDVADLRRAVELYRAYVEIPDSGSRRDDAVQHLKEMVPLLQDAEAAAADPRARVIVSTDIEGAVARVGDGEPQAIPATFQLEPGRYPVVIEAPGYLPQTIDTTAVAGSTIPLNVELTPRPGQLTVRAPEGARVAVDGRAIGLAPLPPVALAPGSHRIAVTARGRVPFVETVQIERTQAIALEAPLEVTGQRVAAWTMIAGSAALAVGAGVAAGFALDAQGDAEEIADDYRSAPLSPADVVRYDDRLADRDARANLAIGLGAGAVALAATGTLLWLFDDEEPAPAPIVTPSIDTAHLGVTGRWRF